MLKFILLFIFIGHFGQSAFSFANTEFIFLNYEQFQSLTSGEQIKYINEIRNLTVKFDEAFDFAPRSVMLKDKLQFFNLFIAQANAQFDSNPSRARSVDIREENAKISVMMDFINGYVRAAKENPKLKSTAKETFLDTYDRLQKISKKNMNSEQRKNFEKNVFNLRENYDLVLTLEPGLQSLKGEISNFTSTSISTASRPKSSDIKVPPAPVKTTQDKMSFPPTNLLKKYEANAPRCLYAGFVISGTNACAARKILSENERLQELAHSDFSCQSGKEFLCNPLVFGFQSDKSPYCINRSRTASKNCQEISNNKDNHNRLHEAWKNPANKVVYENYQKSLNELCNSNSKNNDIQVTCKVVMAQFNETVRKEFPGVLAQMKSDGQSKTDKSLKKN